MILLIALSCLSTVWGYPSFQDEIPNGGEVPHPCKVNYIWRGVGHLNPLGGGARNPFGDHFTDARHTWTKALCEMDSDGDGKTNGEELGDPDCVWKKGDTPAVTVGITHPGVCTPYPDPACKEANQWIDCSAGEFQCDALSEDGMQNITVRFPETAVPSKETNYYCMTFELPTDDDYHLVATAPYIDNEEIMHHILLFGCDETNGPITDVPMNFPYPCGMAPHHQCITVIGIWTVGFSGECGHKDIGFRIGTNGFKKAAFQFHWNNPMLRPDFMDSSGMTLYYTANRRVHDAVVMVIGQNYLEIPPGEVEYIAEGTCTNECSSRLLTDTVYVTRAFNHMHYMGRKQRIEHYRDGVKLRDVTNDELYSFDSPVIYEFPEPIEIRPGDELKTTCTYRSVGKDRTTFQGDGTSDEMCFGFLSMHPAENIKLSFCTAWKGIDTCKLWRFKQDFPVVNDCNVHIFQNESHPDQIQFVSQIMNHCKPFRCLKECKKFFEEELSGNKCIQGDLGDLYREWARYYPNEMLFWAAIDSCKTEIAEDAFQCEASKCNECNEDGGVSGLTSSLFVLFVSLFINFSM